MPEFATAINCIDGRVQQPVAEWLRQKANVKHVDMVTIPGPDKAMSSSRMLTIEDLRQQVRISVKAHGSRVVAVAGHYDCAANPGSRHYHVKQIRHAVDVVALWGFPVDVYGLWVNENWQVEVVAHIPRPKPVSIESDVPASFTG
jgi:hypothetical protein